MKIYHNKEAIIYISNQDLEIPNTEKTEIDFDFSEKDFKFFNSFPFFFHEGKIKPKKFISRTGIEFTFVKDNFILCQTKDVKFLLTFVVNENFFILYAIEKLEGNFTNSIEIEKLLFYLAESKKVKIIYSDLIFLKIYNENFKNLIGLKKEIYFEKETEIKIVSPLEYDNFISSLEQDKAKKDKEIYYAKIKNDFEISMLKIDYYSTIEKFSFSFKVDESKKWLSLSEAEKLKIISLSEGFLVNEAIQKDIASIDSLTESILEKSNIYSIELAKNIRAKKICFTLIEKAKTKIDLEKISFKDYL